MHALSIVARLLADPAFSASALGLADLPEDETPLQRVLTLRGAALSDVAQTWSVDASGANALAAKIEELVWMNVVIYGVRGWTGRRTSCTGAFNADFFL